jgi:hypothetical protein
MLPAVYPERYVLADMYIRARLLEVDASGERDIPVRNAPIVGTVTTTLGADLSTMIVKGVTIDGFWDGKSYDVA